ncbi:unnamed protein product [Phytomonas sp. Hart1]|nr:unnamed protein product [Phytomonas sp. Hart1]|eukprot:CCW67605.1 unnamed protein product [Phytomonas sp. isolate Hart1]
MARLETREIGSISKLPNGNVWKQVTELNTIVTEVDTARAAQREAEDRADQLANELEVAVERIHTLDKRLVDMKHATSVHQLQAMHGRLRLESENNKVLNCNGSEGSMFPLPTSDETKQWPLAARSVLNRLVSHSEGLVMKNSENSRHSSFQIQKLECSCEKLEHKLKMKTEELRQLQDECLSLRKEKEIQRLYGAQWYEKLQEVREEAQLVSELVRISKGNAEETALSCMTAEIQQDAFTKANAHGTVIISQANQATLSKCKGFAQQVLQDMHAVSQFLLALRDMDICETNGYKILQSLADGSVPPESLFLDAKTVPTIHNTLEIEKRNTVSCIKENKDLVVRAVERALEKGFQIASDPKDSKTHTTGFTEESGKSSEEVSQNHAPHNYRGSTEAFSIDKVIFRNHNDSEYDDEIVEADKFEETDRSRLSKKPTRYNSELEAETSGHTVSWPSNEIWADVDLKKVSQSASYGSQMPTTGLPLLPHNGDVDLSSSYYKQRSLPYTSRGEVEENPDICSMSRPPRFSSNSVWKFNYAGDSRRSVNISDSTVLFPSEHARRFLDKCENRTREKPLDSGSSACAGSTLSLSTSRRLSQTNESLSTRVIPLHEACKPGEDILDENYGFSNGVAAPTRLEHASSVSEQRIPEVAVTFIQQNASANASTPSTFVNGFQQDVMAFGEQNVKSENAEHVDNDAKSSIIPKTPKSRDMVGIITNEESPILEGMVDTSPTIDHFKSKLKTLHTQDYSTPTRQTDEMNSTDSPAIKFHDLGTGPDRARISPCTLKDELEQDTLTTLPQEAVFLPSHKANSSDILLTSIFPIPHNNDENGLYNATQLLQPKERSATMPPHSQSDKAGDQYTHVQYPTGVHEAVSRTIEDAAEEAGEVVLSALSIGSVLNKLEPGKMMSVPRAHDHNESTLEISAPFAASTTHHLNTSAFSATLSRELDINSQGSRQISNNEKQSQSSRPKTQSNDDDNDSMPSLGFFNSTINMKESQPGQMTVQLLGLKHLENVAFVKEKFINEDDSLQSTMLLSESEKYRVLPPEAHPSALDSTSSISENNKCVGKDTIETLQRQQSNHEFGKPPATGSYSGCQDKGTKLTRQVPVSSGMERPTLPRLQSSLFSGESLSGLNSTQVLSPNPVAAINTEKSTLPRRATPAMPEPQSSTRLLGESSAFVRLSPSSEEKVKVIRQHRQDASRERVVPDEDGNNGPDGAAHKDEIRPDGRLLRGQLPQPQALSEALVISTPGGVDVKEEINGHGVPGIILTDKQTKSGGAINIRRPPRPVKQSNQIALPPSLLLSKTVQDDPKEVYSKEKDVAALTVIQTTDTNAASSKPVIGGQQEMSLKCKKNVKSNGDSQVSTTVSDTERREAVSRILERIKKRKAESSRMSQNVA